MCHPQYNECIVLGTTKLAFTVVLNAVTVILVDTNRTLLKYLRCTLATKLSIKHDCNELACFDDADILTHKKEKQHSLRRNFSTKALLSVVLVSPIPLHHQARRFISLCDFEVLNDDMPSYQSGLLERITSELVFNDYDKATQSTNIEARYTNSLIILTENSIPNVEATKCNVLKADNSIPNVEATKCNVLKADNSIPNVEATKCNVLKADNSIPNVEATKCNVLKANNSILIVEVAKYYALKAYNSISNVEAAERNALKSDNSIPNVEAAKPQCIKVLQLHSKCSKTRCIKGLQRTCYFTHQLQKF
ncbi:hypothetical protein CHS0354_031368 [Potamilus streckersoni]|uniref:Uncharacterized protein n=1 Tax=Potamilus streckersoni TaxID=2493646 RepID=A0AAE0VWK9_9BIVA|nr:hypothetical protein CHS0354_031368 [Potamilus streckersoni]